MKNMNESPNALWGTINVFCYLSDGNELSVVMNAFCSSERCVPRSILVSHLMD